MEELVKLVDLGNVILSMGYYQENGMAKFGVIIFIAKMAVMLKREQKWKNENAFENLNSINEPERIFFNSHRTNYMHSSNNSKY